MPSRDEVYGLRAKLINQHQPMIDILVRPSRMNLRYELQEDIQNKELICEESEIICKEFEAAMALANSYISEPK